MDQPLPKLTLQGVSETHLLPQPKYYPAPTANRKKALFITSLLLLLPFSPVRVAIMFWMVVL